MRGRIVKVKAGYYGSLVCEDNTGQFRNVVTAANLARASHLFFTDLSENIKYQFSFLGNCPPTPPLS